MTNRLTEQVLYISKHPSQTNVHILIQQNMMNALIVTNKHVKLKDQLWDYQYHGYMLLTMNFYEFTLNTYAVSCKDNSPTELIDLAQISSDRPKNIRISYLPQAKKVDKCRAM